MAYSVIFGRVLTSRLTQADPGLNGSVTVLPLDLEF